MNLLLDLFLFENLPPLTETLGGAAGDLGGDFLPLVAVLGLKGDDEGLFLGGEGSLFDSGFEIILPTFETGFGVAI